MDINKGLIKRRDCPSVQYTPQMDCPSIQYAPRRNSPYMQYTPQRDPKKSNLVIVCIVSKSEKQKFNTCRHRTQQILTNVKA